MFRIICIYTHKHSYTYTYIHTKTCRSANQFTSTLSLYLLVTKSLQETFHWFAVTLHCWDTPAPAPLHSSFSLSPAQDPSPLVLSSKPQDAEMQVCYGSKATQPCFCGTIPNLAYSVPLWRAFISHWILSEHSVLAVSWLEEQPLKSVWRLKLPA